MGNLEVFLGRHHRSLVVWTIIAGVSVRIALWVFFKDFFIGPDSEGYTGPAHALLLGQPFDHFFRTPTYPFFIAGLLRIFDYNYKWIVLAQHMLGVLAALCFYGAFRVLFPKDLVGSYVLLVVLLFDKHLLFHQHLIQSEALFVFIESFIVLLLALWARKPSLWISALIGAQMGFLILCRPIGMVFIPLVLVGMGLSVLRQKIFAKGAMQLLAAIIPLLLISGSWAYRNYVRYGEFTITYPPITSNLLFGTTAEFIDYNSPLHGVVKEKLRPILTEGYRAIDGQLASGIKRFDVVYKGSNIFNWVYEQEPWKIVMNYAREDLLKKGVPASEISEMRLQEHAGEIIKDIAFEAIRNNGWSYLTKWVVPEFFTLFLSHTSSHHGFINRAWLQERFYDTLIAKAYANTNTPLPPLYDQVLKGRRSDLHEIVELQQGRKADLDKMIHFLKEKRLDVNGAIQLISNSSFGTARTSHKVLYAADVIFLYFPFPFSAVLGFVYFIALILLVVGLFLKVGCAVSHPEILWAILLLPLPYGFAVAALNDSVVRYVVPIEPFLWFAGLYAVLWLQEFWAKTHAQPG